ncbi:MAG: sulfotransferase [Alphaproteobacteria bacterium]|nr:sulfotransferase [Alphaproteobacteria bacterium]
MLESTRVAECPQLSPRIVSALDPFATAAANLNARRTVASVRLRHLLGSLQAAAPDRVEHALRQYLATAPDDPDALAHLAYTIVGRGRPKEAAALLHRALELAPDFLAARYNYAELLLNLNRFELASAETNRLLAEDGSNPLFRLLRARTHESLGEIEQARTIAQGLVHDYPLHPDSWMTFGHASRASGHQEQAIAAYRRAIELKPTFGLAYNNLAHLKTFRFSEAEIASMVQALKRSDLTPEDRSNLQFAFAKSCEDRADYARAFEFYAKANAAMRLRFVYDADAITAGTRRTKAAFTRDFFEQRSGWGCPAPDPIFIVGRQRSGSTLLEQILASHSAIEGTTELPYIPEIVGEIADVEGTGGANYFENLAKLSPEQLARFGEQYLQRSQLHRKAGKPFFIDKDPGNHFHVGLIALILPNAKIIDARRNPAAACWSQFTLQFKMTNLRLTEFARAWRDYAELMAHFDAVLSGKVHRVIYEDLVTNTEAEVRRLLEYLGLPFEESCLRFYETERAVMTPSSEQVRRPINRQAIDHWRHFEPWLGPMLKTLGEAFTLYPAVPPEWR